MDMSIFDSRLFWEVVVAIFTAGSIWSELKAIRKDISRLEAKQDEYNNVKLRTAELETIVRLQSNDLAEMKRIAYGNRGISK